MTVSNQESSVTAEGNGATTSWSFTFLIPTTASCVVQVYDTTVTPNTLTDITDFAVTGIGNVDGGVVTYPVSGTPLSSGQFLSIYRVVPLVQETSIRNQGAFYPAAVEQALDYITFALQQLQTAITAIEADIDSPLPPVVPVTVTGSFSFATTVDLLAAFNNSVTLDDGTVAVTAGRSAVGDNGGAVFYYDATDVTSTDNGGNIRVDGASRRWIYNGPVLYAGLWGVVGEGTDDTDAIQRVVATFSQKGVAVTSGEVLFTGISHITKPIIYAGTPGHSLVLKGNGAKSRGLAGTTFKWTGTGYPSMIIFYGANESFIDGINLDTGTTGSGLVQAMHITADNVNNTTLAGSVAAGTNKTVALTSATNVAAGRALGIGVGLDSFEVVYVKAISGSTITADFQNAHSAGAQVGNVTGSAACGIKNSAVRVPIMAHTTLSSGVTAGSSITVTPVSIANIAVGQPLFIGSLTPNTLSEVVYPTSVSASTFVATLVYAHDAGESVMTAVSGVLIGNVTANATDQVSETVIEDYNGLGYAADNTTDLTYSTLRYIEGGNVKNHTLTRPRFSGSKYGIAFENSTGTVVIDAAQGVATLADLLLLGTAEFTVTGLETEDAGARMLIGQAGSTNIGSITLIGCSWEGSAPADDYIIKYAATLTMIGCRFDNTRTGASVPKIQAATYFDPDSFASGNIVSIGNFFNNATDFTPIFYDGSGNPYNYSQYPINNLFLPKLTSIGDYGDTGNLQAMIGSLAVMGSGPTIDSLSAGISFDGVARVNRTMTALTLTFADFSTAATSLSLTILGLPKRTKITGIYADVTAAFTGVAGTVQLRAGTTASGVQLLVAADVKSAAVTLGLADADLGASITRAAAIQGGYIPNWTAATNIFCQLVSGSGNLSGLTTGSVTFYVELERFFTN